MGDLIKNLLDSNNLFHAIGAVIGNDFLDLRRRKFSFLSATGFVVLLAVLYFGDYEFNRFYFNPDGATLVKKISNADVFVVKVLVVLIICYMAFSFLEAQYRDLSAISLTENFAAALILLGVLTACYGMLAVYFRETRNLELESIHALVNSARVAGACALYLCGVFIYRRIRKIDFGKVWMKLLVVAVAIFGALTGAQYFLFYKSWIG